LNITQHNTAHVDLFLISIEVSFPSGKSVWNEIFEKMLCP